LIYREASKRLLHGLKRNIFICLFPQEMSWQVAMLFPYCFPGAPMKLTQAAVDALTLPAGRTDHIEWDEDEKGFGRRLRVAAGGKVNASWVVQYRVGHRQRRMTLDGRKSAKQARAEAEEIIAKVVLNQDPQGEKKQKLAADRHTFKALAEKYLADKKPEVRPRTFIEWKRYLQESYFKPLHNLPVDSILRKDVADRVLAIKHKNGQVAAARARSAISALFSWAMSAGLVENNPVIGSIKPEAPPERERTLSDPELLLLWRATEEGTEFNRIVRLLITSGQRRSEVGGMCWSELDLARAEWVIPAERAKNGREHCVPLGSLALDVIRSVPEVVGKDTLFARSNRGFTSWAEHKRALDKRLGWPDSASWTLHDLRRTLSTGLNDLNVEPHIVEQLLNHRGHKAGVKGVYNKSRYTAAVKNAVALWNNHITTIVTVPDPAWSYKGSDSYNQDLSERRAEAVKRYLAEQFKLAPEQLLAIGFGKTKLKNL
jgi:integrase